MIAFGLDKGSTTAMGQEAAVIASIAQECRGVHMSNSIFDTCQVACGSYGAFVHHNCRIWDIAAAVCILQECGGVCTDVMGRPLDLRNPLDKAERTYRVCLSTAAVHPALMGAMSRAEGTAQHVG